MACGIKIAAGSFTFGMQTDLAAFKRDTDTVLRTAAEKKTVGKSQ